MSKKIVVITGSPRKNGNSFAMTKVFIEAAEKSGHSVTRFDSAFLKVDGCRACNACFKEGKACVFDDDFNKVAAAIEKADAVVLTMPVYWYTMPGKIKNIIDKLYSLYRAGRVAGKECALISCCEENDAAVFEGVSIPYVRSSALLGWKDVGQVLIPGVNNIGDIDKTDGCSLAAKLAEAF